MTSGSSVSSTRRATLLCNSRYSRSRIWRLVTYVQSLSAGKDVTTEDFSGKTVERTGH